MRRHHPLIAGVGVTAILAALMPPEETKPRWMRAVLGESLKRKSRGWRRHVRRLKAARR